MLGNPIVSLSGEDGRVTPIILSLDLILVRTDRTGLMTDHLDAPAVVITPRYISARGLYSNAHNACVCSRYSGDIDQFTVKYSIAGSVRQTRKAADAEYEEEKRKERRKQV